MKKNGKCKNNYPKPFCSQTSLGKNSYPKYWHRNNGNKIKIRGVDLDNQWVVPYNLFMYLQNFIHILT